jgi:hypothetical protein
MVWNFENTSQAKMSFDKSANVSVVFVLQTNTESVKYKEGGSLKMGDLILDISLTLIVNSKIHERS